MFVMVVLRLPRGGEFLIVSVLSNSRVVFKSSFLGSFVISSFEERHNHCLCLDVSKPFFRVNHKLDIGHQNFVVSCAKANIGPVKSYRLYKEMGGRYFNVGATSIDFCDFKHDLLPYIASGDA